MSSSQSFLRLMLWLAPLSRWCFFAKEFFLKHILKFHHKFPKFFSFHHHECCSDCPLFLTALPVIFPFCSQVFLVFTSQRTSLPSKSRKMFLFRKILSGTFSLPHLVRNICRQNSATGSTHRYPVCLSTSDRNCVSKQFSPKKKWLDVSKTGP